MDHIVGVYDAPVRARSSKETALTAVASQIAEQIKQNKNSVDAVALSVSVIEDGEEEEEKVTEV